MDLPHLKYWPSAKNQRWVLNLNSKYLFKQSVNHLWKKLVSLAIYISLCMGVPRDNRNLAHKLYKHGMTSIDDYRSDRGRREIKRDRERPSAEPSKNNLRISGKTKISLELGVRSKS